MSEQQEKQSLIDEPVTAAEKENSEFFPIIESILFMMGKSVDISSVALAIEVDKARALQILCEMADTYRADNRGIQLIFLENRVQLCTKPEYFDYLVRIASQPKKPVLTDSVLETLSIVAYKQPVTRGEIERIRGVKSDHAITKLIDYELIEEVGRLDAPGRPILFATTEEFLRCFGVSSVSELPEAQPDRIEEFKEEAEKEIPVTL